MKVIRLKNSSLSKDGKIVRETCFPSCLLYGKARYICSKNALFLHAKIKLYAQKEILP